MPRKKGAAPAPVTSETGPQPEKHDYVPTCDCAGCAETRARTQTSLEKIYGKPGIPRDDSLPTLSPMLALEAPKSANDDPPVPKDEDDDPPFDVQEELEKSRPHAVTLIRDTILTFPPLYYSVYLTGTEQERREFSLMFSRADCYKADTPEEADLVVFAGGEDVNPKWYQEDVHSSVYYDMARDIDDIKLYLKCLELGIPMLGICRGFQFLHVMNGGKLWQDIDNHQTEHPIWDNVRKVKVDRASSVHHQSVRESKDLDWEVIACCSRSSRKIANPKVADKNTKRDVEAAYYPKTACLGIQGHPEYTGYPFFTKWALDTIDHFFNNNPDFTWKDHNQRMDPDILKNRPKMTGINPVVKEYFQLKG